MKEGFLTTLKNKTEKELNIIAKDHIFYSLDERNAAIQELESRNNKIDTDLIIVKQSLKQSQKDKSDGYYNITFKDLLPSKKYLFTPLIIYFNAFIFLLMALTGIHPVTPKIEALILWGGNLGDLTLSGQYWRLLSSFFLHAGVLHLLFNMYALLYVGSLLEPVLGKERFLFSYLLSGLFASLTSSVINENIVSVGASGAIFGLYGLLIILLAFKKIKIPEVSNKNLLLSIIFFIGYNLIYSFKEQGIDNVAHIGGLLSGSFIGLIFLPTFQHANKTRWISIGLVTFFLICSFVTIWLTPDKFRQYDQTMQEFSINENKALWMYQEDLFDKTDSFKERIQSEGIDLWQKNIDILKALPNLPTGLQKRVDLLLEYAELRKESCEVLLELTKVENKENKEKLITISKEIEAKIIEIQNFDKINH